LNATTGINFKSFWLSNQVYVPNAPRSLVTLLSLLPGVVGIEEEKIYQLMKPVEVNLTDFVSSRQSSGNAWGIDKIQAPTAWTTTGGNNGVGIVVANIDTGVLGSHEALVGNYRGTYGWFDPAGKTTSPNDKQGHGTHTMGTICGTKGIGV
jgi:subtilisin family serine protease